MTIGPALLVPILALGAAHGYGQTIAFDDQKAGEGPAGWTCALTGQGKPGVWTVSRDETAPSSPQVLAQTDADATSYRFPHCVLDAVTARDVDLSVRFKPISGKEDQAGGLVWRYRDKDNYYVVRANALESNVVMYKLENGKRSDLDPVGAGPRAYGKKAEVPSGAWSQLRVVVRGSLASVSLNGEKLFDVEDTTFTEGGKVGIWTKADSVIHFDDFTVAAKVASFLGGVRHRGPERRALLAPFRLAPDPPSIPVGGRSQAHCPHERSSRAHERSFSPNERSLRRRRRAAKAAELDPRPERTSRSMLRQKTSLRVDSGHRVLGIAC